MAYSASRHLFHFFAALVPLLEFLLDLLRRGIQLNESVAGYPRLRPLQPDLERPAASVHPAAGGPVPNQWSRGIRQPYACSDFLLLDGLGNCPILTISLGRSGGAFWGIFTTLTASFHLT